MNGDLGNDLHMEKHAVRKKEEANVDWAFGQGSVLKKKKKKKLNVYNYICTCSYIFLFFCIESPLYIHIYIHIYFLFNLLKKCSIVSHPRTMKLFWYISITVFVKHQGDTNTFSTILKAFNIISEIARSQS